MSESLKSSGLESRRASLEKSKATHVESLQENEAYIVTGNTDGLQRELSNRKLQLVAIGGSIGTALFLSIGGVLNKSGPGSLFLAFLVYNIFLALINNCMAEMTVYMPVSGSFIRMAGHWVDDALGFCVGWNFFLFQVVVIPFEITALTLVLSFWSENIPVPAICGGCIALYILLNVYAVAVYGEAEFWLSSGKVLLLIILFCFTFVTMIGGNPQHDAYGFRNWSSPGFLAALWFASFTCVGPEFTSMASAEAKHPRTYMKTAFKVVYWRMLIFFMGGALAVGILVPYNDATLNAIYRAGTGHSGSAAASPYIIAMKNMNISVLPHIITALIASTIFSAGNTYVYCATRSLYGLALGGRAPGFLTKCTKKGVPIYCFAIVMLFPFLSFLQMSSSTATVLDWLINLATGATIIDYIVICITYISFHRACKAQGFNRANLPYYGRLQPWCAYIGLVWEVVIVLCYGYKSLRPFDVSAFLTAYTMPILVPILFVGWKLAKGTKWLKPEEVDLTWEAPHITAYERAADEPPVGWFRDCYSFFLGKAKAARVDA
ncbi:amino acid permease/ SLC12A domain-containing protein [Hypoxylon sp. FL1857]|nr:amino acid permease/ SLC12A domain-containing protein [Hypoxylon sp. FL1857]